MQLPKIIADNAGYDSVELVSQLKAAHNSGKHSKGIDMMNGTLGDMDKIGIVESFNVKMAMVTAAAEAAEMILRVDNILKSSPRPRAPDRHPC